MNLRTPTLDAPATRAEDIAERLAGIRRQTLDLIEPLSEPALNAVHDPLMSPIVWDLGHIATFEDLWLVQQAFGRPPLREQLGRVYDPFTAPRSGRGGLPYLRSDDCFAYMRSVRERVLECLDAADLSERAGPLLRHAYVYELVARHELQHSETILQTLRIMAANGEPYRPSSRRALPAGGAPSDDMVLVEGGSFEIGAGGAWFAYDNERAPHEVELEPFWIDRQPVTNARYVQFVGERGYERAEWWSPAGWDWRERHGVGMPRYWERDGESFLERSFDGPAPLDPTKPVCHVAWYEADAFARYAGRRLPTEAEWERAASFDPAGTKRRYPWGDRFSSERANLGQLGFAPAPAGAYPHGSAACAAEQMAGDVWEWTASGFERYPGFEPFPYEQYSSPFFGGPYKVLRGGAWSTQPDAVSTTFRNWDHPDRRQIFAGFRCARDADPAGGSTT